MRINLAEDTQRFLSAIFPILLLAQGCMHHQSPPDPLPRLPLESFEGAVREHLEECVELNEQALVNSDPRLRYEALMESGKIYHSYGLFNYAVQAYRSALESQGGDPVGEYLLAIALQENGDLEGSREILKSWVKKETGHPNPLIALAQIEYELGNFQESNKLAQRVLLTNPLSVPALSLLGQIRLQQNEIEEAVELLRQALELSPGASALRYPYGLALRKLGQLNQAENQMNLRGSAFPRAADPWIDEVLSLRRGGRVHLNEGTHLFAEGLYARAEKSFLKALEYDPESPIAHLNLGSTRVKMGRYSEARNSLQEAIRLNPQAVLAWFDLGVLEALEGSDSLAIECYDNALAIDPTHSEARFNRANANRRMGNYQEAVEDLKMVIEVSPENESAWLAGAVSLIRLEKLNESLDWVKLSLLAHSASPRLQGLFARLLACNKRSSKQELRDQFSVMNRITAQRPDLELLEASAMLQAALGLFKEAEELQRALIKAAKNAGQEKIAERLKPHLEAYSLGNPPFDPWPE